MNSLSSCSGLGARQIERHIQELLKLKAVIQKGDRYFAPVSQADSLEMTDLQSLSEMLRQVTYDIQKNRERILKEKNSLSIYSAFSVRSENVPDLKIKLQAAIYGILDDFQDDSGNQVQQVFISLHGNPFVSED